MVSRLTALVLLLAQCGGVAPVEQRDAVSAVLAQRGDISAAAAMPWTPPAAFAAEMSAEDADLVNSVLLELGLHHASAAAAGAASELVARTYDRAADPDGAADGAPADDAAKPATKPQKCPKSRSTGVCNGKGDCDESKGKCTCKANWGGAGCTVDMLLKRKVWLGSHLSPLPAHLLAVCEQAIQTNKQCPGYGMLVEMLCAQTAPLVEDHNCGRKSLERTCEDKLMPCKELCNSILGWFCGLTAFDASLVARGKAPGSIAPPAASPAPGNAASSTDKTAAGGSTS